MLAARETRAGAMAGQGQSFVARHWITTLGKTRDIVMSSPGRHSTGISKLDEMLGGGLLPGTLTVVIGATGIGKTQLGIQYANAGLTQDGRRGAIFDMSARGDSQSHSEYAARLFDWTMSKVSGDQMIKLEAFFAKERDHGDYLHVFDYSGRRVTKRDLEFDQWQQWQAELNAKLRSAIAFLYGNCVQGTRRFVVDGIEPTDRPHESIQFNLFEYVYHQVIRKDPEWVARDLFRESYRRNADSVANHVYDATSNSCVLLYTSHDALLDDMIARPLDEGDALANANTLIYLGKIRDGNRVARGLYIAKHRGSACDDQIARYHIDDQGLQIEPTSP